MSETANKAIFLSYARDDAAAARRIAEALRSSGLEVWFDENELRGGDAWDAKIRKQINDCTLFVAIISQHTEARNKGYFRLEWKLAVQQTHLLLDGVPFLLPVVIDNTPESTAAVPPEFMQVQWTRLPDALPSPQFVAQVKRLLAPHEVAQTSSPAVSRESGGTPAPRQPRVSLWPWAAIAVAVLGAGAFFATRKAEPPAASTPAINDKSIAVLPFKNNSTDKDANAVFTDGMQEDVLTNLQHIRELRVVSRTSVEQYRATTKTIPQIARELGVTYILEGSVQRDGNKVRVTGQLIRAAAEEHVWAENYTRDLTDIFAIQSELAQAIAGELKAAISPQEKNLLERKPTENLAAYDLWIKSRDLNYRDPSFALGSAQTGESLLQTAVELDPKFASAWADLAATHAYLYSSGYDRSPARLAKAKAAIDRAVNLAPDSPDVTWGLASYYYLAQRDYARATEQTEKILRLEPNFGAAWSRLATIQRSEGRWGESIANSRKAVQLDPGNIGYVRVLLGSLRYVRRFDEAMTVVRRLLVIDPDPGNEFVVLVSTEASLGVGFRETEEFIARDMARAQLPERPISRQKILALYSGEFTEFIRLDHIQRYVDVGNIGALSPTRIQAREAAEIYLAVGDTTAARERLEDFPQQIRTRLETDPTNGTLWQALSRMEFILGRRDEALRCAVKATELPEAKDGFDGPPAWANLAVIHAWLGDKDRAIAEFAEILRKPSYLNVQLLKNGAVYFPLRGDARFEALLNDPKNNAPLF